MTYDLVEGTTGTLQFQLLENGVPIDLAGATVTLLLEDQAGLTITSPGGVTISDSTNGKVQLDPTDSTIFASKRGPYYARWKVVNSVGAASYVPSTSRDVWNVFGQ